MPSGQGEIGNVVVLRVSIQVIYCQIHWINAVDHLVNDPRNLELLKADRYSPVEPASLLSICSSCAGNGSSLDAGAGRDSPQKSTVNANLSDGHNLKEAMQSLIRWKFKDFLFGHH
jgi:hypothetical protein